LYVKSPLLPLPILHGGAHENDRRAGTENLPAILGLAEAIVRFVPTPPFPDNKISLLADRLISGLDAIDAAFFLGERDPSLRLFNTVSFFVEGSDSIALLSALDLEGICASSGSACSSGSVNPSHVVRAMGVNENGSNSLVRLSLGRSSSAEEIDFVLNALPCVIDRCLSNRIPVNIS
jgi:cysteine desulfurase